MMDFSSGRGQSTSKKIKFIILLGQLSKFEERINKGDKNTLKYYINKVLAFKF